MQKKIQLTLAGAAVAALAGCTDPAYITGQPAANPKTTGGVALGAALGGLIGSTIGSKDATSIAAGAVAGAVVGGLVGQQLDKQKRELEASLANDEITVTNTGDELIVLMPQGILFDTDSSVVKSSLYGDLGALSANLRNYPDSTVLIAGHTDNVGAADYNLTLSQERASAVSRILQSDGVAAGRISAVGYGEDQPVASNLNEEGRAQNRRVEIVIRPNA